MFFIKYFHDPESNKHLLTGQHFLVQEYAAEPATYVDVYVRQGQIQAFKCYHYTQELIPMEDLSRGRTLQLSNLHIGENKRPMRTPSNFRNVTCHNRQDVMWLAQQLATGLNLKGAWGFHTATSRRNGLNVIIDVNVRVDAVQAGRFNEELGRWLREMLDKYGTDTQIPVP